MISAKKLCPTSHVLAHLDSYWTGKTKCLITSEFLKWQNDAFPHSCIYKIEKYRKLGCKNLHGFQQGQAPGRHLELSVGSCSGGANFQWATFLLFRWQRYESCMVSVGTWLSPNTAVLTSALTHPGAPEYAAVGMWEQHVDALIGLWFVIKRGSLAIGPSSANIPTFECSLVWLEAGKPWRVLCFFLTWESFSLKNNMRGLPPLSQTQPA